MRKFMFLVSLPLVASYAATLPVIPAKAGIQTGRTVLESLDSRFRGNDDESPTPGA
jgi:hypothetical protein